MKLTIQILKGTNMKKKIITNGYNPPKSIIKKKNEQDKSKKKDAQQIGYNKL